MNVKKWMRFACVTLAISILGGEFATAAPPEMRIYQKKEKKETELDPSTFTPEQKWLNEFVKVSLPVTHSLLMKMPETTLIKKKNHRVVFTLVTPDETQKRAAQKSKKEAYGFGFLLLDDKEEKFLKGNVQLLLLGDPTNPKTQKLVIKDKATLLDACPS